MTDAVPSATREVVVEATAEEMQQLMMRVVCEGTGERAQVEDFDVAGKTGTGFKAQPDGTYLNAAGERVYYASFVGFFPAEDPQVTVLVSIDEPPAGTDNRFGGTAAAPVFPELVPMIAHEMGSTHHRRHRLRSGLSDERRHRERWRRHSTGHGVGSATSPSRVPSGRLRAVVGDASIRVTDVTHDSAPSYPGGMFACVVGEPSDGHAFAPSAVESGASALLVERELPLDVAQIVVDDSRAVLGHVAAAFHGDPSRRSRWSGSPGTNGKTTTSHLVAAILRSTGLDAA